MSKKRKEEASETIEDIVNLYLNDEEIEEKPVKQIQIPRVPTAEEIKSEREKYTSREEEIRKFIQTIETSQVTKQQIYEILMYMYHDRKWLDIYSRDDASSHLFDYLTVLEVDSDDPYFGTRASEFDGKKRIFIFSPVPFNELCKPDDGIVFSTPIPVSSPNFYYLNAVELFKISFGYPVLLATASDYYDENFVVPSTHKITTEDLLSLRSAIETTFIGEKIWTMIKNAFHTMSIGMDLAKETFRQSNIVASYFLKHFGRTVKPETRVVIRPLKYILYIAIIVAILIAIYFIFK
jgi:hypothetical protein